MKLNGQIKVLFGPALSGKTQFLKKICSQTNEYLYVDCNRLPLASFYDIDKNFNIILWKMLNEYLPDLQKMFNKTIILD